MFLHAAAHCFLLPTPKAKEYLSACGAAVACVNVWMRWLPACRDVPTLSRGPERKGRNNVERQARPPRKFAGTSFHVIFERSGLPLPAIHRPLIS
jgi:hypothetical protein